MKITLPKNKDQLAIATRQIVNEGHSRRARNMIDWQYAYWYMQGCRQFRVVSYKTGHLNRTFESPDGTLKFTYEGILSRYQKEYGKLLRLNTLPLVKAKGIGLDQVRRVSMGQVTLDHLAGDTDAEVLKSRLIQTLLLFGTGGLALTTEKRDGRSVATIEDVPPWELLPVPANPTRESDLTGIIRNRMVPYERVKKIEDIKLPDGDKKARLNLKDVRHGERETGNGAPDSVSGSWQGPYSDDHMDKNRTFGGAPSAKPSAYSEYFVELTEMWLYDSLGRACRYVMMLGDWIAADRMFGDDYQAKKVMGVGGMGDLGEELPEVDPEDYGNPGNPGNSSSKDNRKNPYVPLTVSRYLPTGSFWGRSFVGPLIGLNEEVERMLSSLYKNVQEYDQLGITLVPSDWGIRREALAATGRPKFVDYQPSLGVPNAGIQRVEPVNSGDFPGRVAASGTQLLDDLAGTSEIDKGEAAGRMDSGRGVGLLYEIAAVRQIPTVASIAQAYTGIYKALLGTAPDLLQGSNTLQLTVVDDVVAGIHVNPENGAIELQKNPIPSPDDVLLDIREREPKMREARKAEVLDMLGRSDPTGKPMLTRPEFLWINYKEQLGFPVVGDDVTEEYRKAMLRNIVQWGDGVTPSPVVVDTTLDDNRIQLERIVAFMRRPTFQFADKKVREAYMSRKQLHEAALGKTFPEQLPYPEMFGEQGVPNIEGLPPQLQGLMREAAGAGPSGQAPSMPPGAEMGGGQPM